MLLVIHNLPSHTRYGDVKSLIQKHCALNNVILDNLVNEGIHKKVTVGVADEGDAVVIERKLNGMKLGGNNLYVEDMRKKKEKSYDTNKGSRWNSSSMPNNLPSLLGKNTLNLGQNTSMLNQNNSVMEQMMGVNTSMMRHNNPMGSMGPLMGQNTSMMGQIAPLMGSPPGQMGQNAPMMVPPPLMGHAPVPFSGPFYMSPQSNDYGNYGSGQPMADQYSSRKDTAPSKIYGYPDTGNRKNVPDKPISVWATSEENSSYSSRGYSGGERDRYETRQSSRRTKWDTDEQYEAVGTRDTSKRVRPWAADHSPPYTRPEYEPFDRSYDRGQDRYSRRTNDSGSNAYQRRPFDSSHSGSNYRSNSPPGFRRGAPRNEYRARDGRSPPPKRLRADYNAPAFKPVPVYSKDKKAPKKVKPTVKKIIERDGVWRSQAAAKIVKEMFTKINTNSTVPQNVAFHKMKTAVRNRLLIIVNNRLEVQIPDQLLLYRRKFKPDEDQCLYNRIIRHILHEMKRKPAETDAQEEADADPDAPKVSQPAKTIVQLAPGPVEKALEKLPKYPQGDKAAYQLQKKNFKKELQEQRNPELDPVLKKAVDLEIDSIKDIILAECTNPQHEGQSLFCKRMNEPDIMDEIRRMLTLNLAKRLLNLGTVPLVRILGVPKPPKKAPLDEFLKTRGVVSLKKSDRKPMYIATCKSYESFDNLCALKDVVIDNVKVLFKPMYLTAPPQKVNHKKKQQQARRQAMITTDRKTDEVNVKTEEKPEERKEDVNVQLQDVKHEIEKSAAEIKKEVVTPLKSKPIDESQVAEVKQELLTPAKNKVEEESVADDKCDDNVAQDDEDDYCNEDDGEEYPIEDPEVNEDDLEDY